MDDTTFALAIIAVTTIGAVIIINGIWRTTRYLAEQQRKADDARRAARKDDT